MIHKTKKMLRHALTASKFISGFAIASVPVWAAGGAGLPWEAAMLSMRSSISGPIAFGCGVIGTVTGGWQMYSDHNSGHSFGRTGVALVAAGGVAMGATSLVTALYPAAGALI